MHKNPVRRRHEQTQKGNPHKLTVDQHIFPSRSIDRFAGANGCVEVMRKGTADSIAFRPDNSYFCARRVWDQKAERGYMREIEGRFQSVGDAVLQGSIVTLDRGMNDAVSEFYMLWQFRFKRFLSPDEDTLIKGVRPERDISKDSEEMLEAGGVMFTRQDGTFPGRFMAGIGIFMDLDRYRPKFEGTTWGILRSDGPEFVVPDSSMEFKIVPLSPTICLVAEAKDQYLGIEDVAAINGVAIRDSRRYYFAKNLSRCPVLRPVPLARRLKISHHH